MARGLAVMPHMGRTVLQGVVSYKPAAGSGGQGGVGLWVRTFRSARRWVE